MFPLLPTRIHGMMDYLMGLLLAASPWLFGFARGGAETWVPVVLGAGALAYSVMTDYELGAARLIPMPVHLGLDGMSGLILAISPWVFGFANRTWAPHLIFGLLEMGSALITQPRPSYGHTPGGTTRAV